ncbi:MAG: phosphonatase-like hydrolase [Chloroherpetonaceae bacterium]|nr:phosphonatase-like hydrolase [Chthonomonadaceae bacterium]MDW8208229.1 phosphonatase-like hydrolase [Chloroherpetonaceae bacterium]
MTPELVVLDMAGTTIHDGDAVNRCLSDALHAEGVTVHRDEVNAYMGLPKPVAIQRLLEQRAENAHRERVMRIHADFQARMIDHYRHSPEVRPVAGTEDALRQLKTAGIRVALDTGFDRQIADVILRRLQWGPELLDTTVTSDEVPRGRPHPDLILTAMHRTGVTDPRRVAKVGDTPADLQEGHAAGCGWVIGVTGGSHTCAELEPYPHTHLIHSVAELPEILIRS